MKSAIVSSQDRQSTAQASKQLAARAPARNSAFGGGGGRAAGLKSSAGGLSVLGLQQRMHVPAAMDISGLITAPSKPAAGRERSGAFWSLLPCVGSATPLLASAICGRLKQATVPDASTSLQPAMFWDAAGVGSGFMGMLGSQAAAAVQSNRNTRDSGDNIDEVEALLQRRSGSHSTASALTNDYPAAVGADHDR